MLIVPFVSPNEPRPVRLCRQQPMSDTLKRSSPRSPGTARWHLPGCARLLARLLEARGLTWFRSMSVVLSVASAIAIYCKAYGFHNCCGWLSVQVRGFQKRCDGPLRGRKRESRRR